jgi:hypothetical protein
MNPPIYSFLTPTDPHSGAHTLCAQVYECIRNLIHAIVTPCGIATATCVGGYVFAQRSVSKAKRFAAVRDAARAKPSSGYLVNLGHALAQAGKPQWPEWRPCVLRSVSLDNCCECTRHHD